VAYAGSDDPFSPDFTGGCTKPKAGAKPSCADSAKKEEPKTIYGLFREDCYATYFGSAKAD